MKLLNRRAFARLLSAAALTGLVSTGLASQATAQDTYNLRFAEFTGPDGARSKAIQWWADEIAERTDGKVNIKIFWGSALAKPTETYKAVTSGIADMGSVLGSYNLAEFPLWNLADMPFTVEDTWAATRAWQEMFKTSPELQEEAKRAKIHVLSIFPNAPFDLLSRKPILSLEDLKGKKVRSNGKWAEYMQLLGAVPVAIGYGETYEALERGTVDATTAVIGATKRNKFYEAANQFTKVSMGHVLCFGLVVNDKVWESMSPELQAIITQVSDEMVDEATRNVMLEQDAVEKELQEGIDGKVTTINVLDDTERARWKAAAQPMTEDWIKQVSEKGVDGAAIVAKLNELNAKYLAERDAKGYPWTR